MIPTRLRPRLLSRRPRWTTRCLSSRASDPLRVLFCGSDDFSCAALEALDGERRRGGVVESVDVMVRPGKAVGRGNKKFREGECALVFYIFVLTLFYLVESAPLSSLACVWASPRSQACQAPVHSVRGQLCGILEEMKAQRNASTFMSGLRLTENITVPIKHLASELDLPIHERDTFTGFKVRPSRPCIRTCTNFAASVFCKPRNSRFIRPLRAAAYSSGRQVRRAERPSIIPPRVSHPLRRVRRKPHV